MPQNQSSGAKANLYGRETAKHIAHAIGAHLLSNSSNEAEYKGESVVIKCAKPKTTNIGVTYKMQEHIANVIAALQNEEGTYTVISLPINIFIKHQRPTRSRGASANKVGLVSRNTFLEFGKGILILPAHGSDT